MASAEIKTPYKRVGDMDHITDHKIFENYEDITHAQLLQAYQFFTLYNAPDTTIPIEDSTINNINKGLTYHNYGTLCILIYDKNHIDYKTLNYTEMYNVDKLMDSFDIYFDFTKSSWIKDGYSRLYNSYTDADLKINYVEQLIKNNVLTPNEEKINIANIIKYYYYTRRIFLNTDDLKLYENNYSSVLDVEKENISKIKFENDFELMRKIFTIFNEKFTADINKLSNNEFIIVRLLYLINILYINMFETTTRDVSKIDTFLHVDRKFTDFIKEQILPILHSNISEINNVNYEEINFNKSKNNEKWKGYEKKNGAMPF